MTSRPSLRPIVCKKPCEKFLAWRHCHQLTLLVYSLTDRFPKSELYGMSSHMRRAAASAAATIAEGAAKRGQREFRRFLDMALGSLSELWYFALLAKDLGFLAEADWNEFQRRHDETGRTTMGLYKAVARRLTLDGRH